MDRSYYYYTYSPELGRKLNTKIYSDTTVSLLELAQAEGLPPSPLLSSVNPFFRTELSKRYMITTTVAQEQVNRTVFSGDFTFSGFELTGGVITDLVVVSKDGAIRGKTFAAPVSYQQLASMGVSQAISDLSGQSITSLGKLDPLFPAGWSDHPFDSNLVSTAAISASNTLSATANVDHLTGVANQKDIFRFTAQPGFGLQADSITRFSVKDKDRISLSRRAFGVTTSEFSVATNSKEVNRLLASDVDFIYNQRSGELVFNANGAESGFGDAGGVFAVLVGRPLLVESSLSLI